MLQHELEELIDAIGGAGFVERALNVHRTTLLRWRLGKTLPPSPVPTVAPRPGLHKPEPEVKRKRAYPAYR